MQRTRCSCSSSDVQFMQQGMGTAPSMSSKRACVSFRSVSMTALPMLASAVHVPRAGRQICRRHVPPGQMSHDCPAWCLRRLLTSALR